MDKNSITGIILITAILGFFWWYNKPTEKQLAEQQHRRDSIAMVENQRKADELQKKANELEKQAVEVVEKDSTQIAQELDNKYGLFAKAATGEQEFITLENDDVKITLSSLGARIYSVELKEYTTHDGRPVMLMDGDQNKFGFHFNHNSRTFFTNDLYFKALPQTSSNAIDFVVNADEGELIFSYSLPENGYMADFNIQTKELGSIISTNSGALEMNWEMDVMAQEKGISFERRYSGIYYRFAEDDVDNIDANKSDSEEIRTKLKWVAFKDQFFSSVFIAKDLFLSARVSTNVPEDDKNPLIMGASSKVDIPFTGDDQLGFNFYFGPNDFKKLKDYEDINLRKLVYLGWGFLRYINLGVIEVFHFFEKFTGNYGLIILLLTILIKLILFPLTYKSYISTAKMKVLKPQIEEINNKIPKEKAMERQQATMALYRKAGVNPMGGCLPMVLQMPILFAMFQFFPTAIDLRGEAFLWADDLSSYDSILQLPWDIPMYGDHVSLFCLLMAITNIVYTRINQEMTQSTQQMPGMKGMMYMMPVMFLVMFNNYASGLSYYYFVSTLITIGQTLLIRRFVNEEALLSKLQANQKKPAKKSKFQQRLEDMQKQQNQAGKKKKR